MVNFMTNTLPLDHAIMAMKIRNLDSNSYIVLEFSSSFALEPQSPSTLRGSNFKNFPVGLDPPSVIWVHLLFILSWSALYFNKN